ncbi:MAG: AAA family ATPase [Sulfobacillus acidophilus]|uniref:AAA family ATPase n=1 Tax=Sulfobacillus acidophilus TaxID=53633 RepID=A0A2T2WD80_9FIRM|nr:MAG: AAA family ATPase [Sulfobacillus acidophilus]
MRIAIIGSPGSGKSTLARQLGAITGCEVVHLDRVFWKPGWVETSRTQFVLAQQRLVEKDAWIIDGNYGSTIEIRMRAADTIIWLDVPRRICLWRALVRTIRNRGQVRTDMAPGCPERIDLQFMQYIWRFPERERPRLVQLLACAQPQGKNVVRLTTSNEIYAYLGSFQHEV